MLSCQFFFVVLLICQARCFAGDFNVTSDDPHLLWDMIKARLDRYFQQHHQKSSASSSISNDIPVWLNISDFGVQQVEVSRLEPIKKIKEQVWNLTRVPVDQQMISFESKLLDNNHSLAYYTIGANAELDVNFLARIFIVTSNGSKFELLADLNDTISDLKKQIKSTLKMDADEQELFICINPLTNDTVTLRAAGLSNNSTIHIKTMVLAFQKANYADCELWLPHKNLAIRNVEARVERECPFGKIECLLYNGRKLSSTTIIRDGSKIKIGSSWNECNPWRRYDWD